ncbi:MAG: hypothetical protein WCE51_12975 [Chthoniobacterales bacterium]
MAEETYNPSPIGNPSVLARRNWWQTKLVVFIGRHTPKCREMVRILSDSMDGPLPLSMRIRKRLHYLICCWCQRYEEQLHYLRETASAFPEHADKSSAATLSTSSKERIKNKISDLI